MRMHSARGPLDSEARVLEASSVRLVLYFAAGGDSRVNQEKHFERGAESRTITQSSTDRDARPEIRST